MRAFVMVDINNEPTGVYLRPDALIAAAGADFRERILDGDGRDPADADKLAISFKEDKGIVTIYAHIGDSVIDTATALIFEIPDPAAALGHAAMSLADHQSIKLLTPLPCGCVNNDGVSRCGKPATVATADLFFGAPGEWVILPICREHVQGLMVVYNLGAIGHEAITTPAPAEE